MAKALLLIGAGEENADVAYETGLYTPDSIVFLRLGRARHLVVPVLEMGRALRNCPQMHIWTPESLGVESKAGNGMAHWVEALLLRQHVREVCVSSDFPLGIAQMLQKKDFCLHVLDDPCPERQCKGEHEILKMAESQAAMVSAMQDAVAYIASADVGKDGMLVSRGTVVTAERLRQRIQTRLLQQGCFARSIIAAPGKQSADPHECGSGPIRAGEPVVLDIFGKHEKHGYWGDLTRTIVKGKPADAMKRMYKAVKDAHAAALHVVRAGISAATVHRMAQKTLERHGFKTDLTTRPPTGFIHATGHGVGLDIHERPSIGKRRQTLRAGHVITIEPGLYYPDLGGVRVEDTLAVTKDGYRLLARCPYTFQV